MIRNDLMQRLADIDAVLQRLPMYAAAWQSFGDDERRDVRIGWGLVMHQADHIRWHWRWYWRPGDPVPDWYTQLQQDLDDNRALIEYLGLPVPDLAPVERRGFR